MTREIVENRLNKKLTGLDHSPPSPVWPGGWPSFVAGDKLEKYLERIETELLKAALENHKHNQTRAAREFGISRSGLIKEAEADATSIEAVVHFCVGWCKNNPPLVQKRTNTRCGSSGPRRP